MKDRPIHELKDLLRRIDGKGYKAYKEIQGPWALPDFLLSVDHVQGDPFAFPSRLSADLPPTFTHLPRDAVMPESRAVGTACLLARRFGHEARRTSPGKGTGRSGEIRMESPGQEVLPQTAVQVGPDGHLEARFTVGLPARGRRVMGKEAATLLTETVPSLLRNTLRVGPVDREEILHHARVNEDADALRDLLYEKGLIAFVVDGAILPRRSGISQEPLPPEEAIPFRSPDSMRVEVELPNAGRIRGMGILPGVTLIVGGGYHGKSTLLRALERGVFNHRPGDGREQVVTDPRSVKIRAEDGRSVVGVDISPFIRDLPTGEDTSRFSSMNASGSTSQAANIMEAVEAGASVLLVDEDTAATNFMIRDRRMQLLIPRDREPITPFVDQVQRLYSDLGISSVLVLGGSGDYLDVADTVVAMNRYRPEEVTERAVRIAEAHPTGRAPESTQRLSPPQPRLPDPSSLDPRKGRRREHLKVQGSRTLILGREEIDLSAVEPLLSRAQTRSIGQALLLISRELLDGNRSLPEILDAVDQRVRLEGLDVLDSWHPGDLAAFRRFELASALNRIRTLKVR